MPAHKVLKPFPACALLLVFSCGFSSAAQAIQSAPGVGKHIESSNEHARRHGFVTRIFTLTDASQQNWARQLQDALLDTLSHEAMVELIESRNSLLVTASPADMEKAAKMIAELDHPRTSYRLVYTLTQYDGEKRLDGERLSMVVVTGQSANLKEDDKVPVLVSAKGSTQNPQYTHPDVGANFNSTLYESKAGATLSYRIDVSSMAANSSADQPIVRQAMLNGMALLTLNKPLLLGSLSVPGSAHRTDIEVEAESLP